MKLARRVTKGFQRVLVFLGCLVIASGVMFGLKPQSASAGTLFGITGCCPNKVVTIDPLTWTLTPLSVVAEDNGVNSLGFTYASALDPGTQRFFVPRYSPVAPSGQWQIITVDILTGAVSESPFLGSCGFIHLGFDSAVGLFGTTGCLPNQFVKIDTSTWTLTPLSVLAENNGANSFGFTYVSALDPGTHRFFVPRYMPVAPSGQWQIIAVDTRTGEVSESPALEECGFIHLGFDPAVGLFGTTGCRPNQFVTIDTSTWTLTPLSVLAEDFGVNSPGFTYASALDPGKHRFFVPKYTPVAPSGQWQIITVDTQTGVVTEGSFLGESFIHLGFVPGFDDAPLPHWAFRQIKAMATTEITAGCSTDPFLYCPDDPITRAQMAVFLVASLGLSPVACTGGFGDVPIDHPFCGFIERLADKGITAGCGGDNFCPDEPVTRGQMAVFLEAALGNQPDPCTDRFGDVPADHPFCGFIDRLAQDGITGGCGGGFFCPDEPVTRGQMAVFLVAAPPPLNP